MHLVKSGEGGRLPTKIELTKEVTQFGRKKGDVVLPVKKVRALLGIVVRFRGSVTMALFHLACGNMHGCYSASGRPLYFRG